jgi:3',5'-cyclic AMP phosphodiesterase CpdA
MALLDVPVYNVLGNHDVNFDVDEPFSGDTYKSLFGPNYYSFDRGNVHFIVLDNIYRTCKKGDIESYWNCYKGYVDKKQLNWLSNNLRNVPEDKLVVICQHIAFEKNAQRTERMSVTNRDEVLDVLMNRENLLVLSGHKHTLQHDFLDNSEDWKGNGQLHQIVCGSVSGSWWTGPKDERNIPSSTQIDGVPNGYFIFEFNGNEFVHNYYPAGNLKKQLRIELPSGTISENDDEIVVNVFNSSKHFTVVAEIDENKTVELKNKPGKDPFMEKSFNTFRDDYKSWASPSVSTQLWKGKLPGNLSEGWHKLKITAHDEYGRSFTSYAVFEVQ